MYIAFMTELKLHSFGRNCVLWHLNLFFLWKCFVSFEWNRSV